MRSVRPWLLAATCSAALVLAVQPAVGSPPGAPDGLSPRARAQIDALARAKAERTPAENKVDSVLLTAAQLRRGRLPGAAAEVRPGIRLNRAGRARVDVHGAITPDLLRRVAALGGVVRNADRTAGVLHAELPLSAVEPLAQLPQVTHIASVAATPIFAGSPQPAPAPTDRWQQLRGKLLQAGAEDAGRASKPAAADSPSPVVSEGDATHGVRQARDRLHVSGIGITVGVLSDGVDSLQTAESAGELPPDVRVLPDADGFGDEGTAMLEIVHDLAPKARLMFATANDGPDALADNIRALRAAGADVIVDDVLYLGESSFQDGPVAKAVLDVTHDGAVYVSSAQNEGNLDDGTSGTYAGTFRPSDRTVGKFAGTAHDFDPGPATQVVDPLSAATADTPVVLQWADPLGAARDDYDLYVLNADDDVVAFSNTVQNGDDDPLEGLFLPAFGGPFRLAVMRFKGEDRYLQVTAFGGRFTATDTLRRFASDGATRGHADVPAALSVAAAPAAAPLPFALEPGDPPNPAGPYPGTFTADQRPERFNSDGPLRIFFTPAGTPLTPGNFTASGGVVRHKPDLTAADGVKTSLETFSPFFGTSAAAPHAAAIAALLLSGRPGSTAAQVRSAMVGTALDLGRPGPDRDTGAGVVMAGPALDALQARAQPYVVPGIPSVSTSTDHDTFLEPGESALVSVPVDNIGDAAATDVSVTVTSPTAGASVTPAIKPYPDVPPGAHRSHRFRVTLSSSAPLGSRVQLSTRVRFDGGFSPQTADPSLLVGQPSTTVVTRRFSGRDLDIPDNDETGVSVHLPIRDLGQVSRATFSIDGTACSADQNSTTVGLQHPFVADLVGRLRGPDGTEVKLFSSTGADGNNFCRTVFTDDATQQIQGQPDSAAPFTGSWQPAEPLSRFVGRPGDGQWTFTVADVGARDTGVLRAVSLHVSGFVPPPG